MHIYIKKNIFLLFTYLKRFKRILNFNFYERNKQYL